MPENGATPSIGTIGKMETVDEERIEVNCNFKDLDAVVTAIREAHPYEEPAIDVYRLLSI